MQNYTNPEIVLQTPSKNSQLKIHIVQAMRSNNIFKMHIIADETADNNRQGK